MFVYLLLLLTGTDWGCCCCWGGWGFDWMGWMREMLLLGSSNPGRAQHTSIGRGNPPPFPHLLEPKRQGRRIGRRTEWGLRLDGCCFWCRMIWLDPLILLLLVQSGCLFCGVLPADQAGQGPRILGRFASAGSSVLVPPPPPLFLKPAGWKEQLAQRPAH